MHTAWFCLIVFMAAIYGILDGYDFGVGIIYPFVGRSREERELARETILPVWDGNEVWLIAGGGLLFFSFPRAYAAAFGGFYLAFMVLLWLLVPRGLSLELRGHSPHPLWRDFCDAWFFGSSTVLAFVFGVALGNVLRGVPLNDKGYFFVSFWTTFITTAPPGGKAGVFDWYTVLTGIAGVAILIVHGAAFLAFRSAGDLHARAAAWIRRAALPAILLSAVASAVTPLVNPNLMENYHQHPWTWIAPAFAALAALSMLVMAWRQKPVATFASTAAFIFFLVLSAAIGLYPSLLTGLGTRANDLTIHNAAAAPYSLRVGLIWASIGIALAAASSVFTHWLFRGRVQEKHGAGGGVIQGHPVGR